MTVHAAKCRYVRLLEEVDRWFKSVRTKHAGEMRCGPGCALCCHGLFDVSLADAMLIAEGTRRLSKEALARITARAAELQAAILRVAPELQPPYSLEGLTEERIDQIVEQVGSLPCSFLGETNLCAIYEFRPLGCRLEGVPMVDVKDGLFGDWCKLNFTKGVPPEALRDLERDYYDMQEMDQASTEILSRALLNAGTSRLTLFIPSLVVELENYWKSLTHA